MSRDFDTDPEEVDELLSLCVSGIASGMNRHEYLEWAPQVLLDHSGPVLTSVRPDGRPGFVNLLAREVWNVTPIPAKGFRYDPIPALGRNDKCSCGSGLKYKRCCIDLPRLSFKGLSLWPHLLEYLPDNQVEKALATGRIPRDMYVLIASEWLEEDRPGKVVKLLQPLFEGSRKPNEHDGIALNVLCDALDALGHGNKKVKLLERVAKSGSSVSSTAWQRLTTMRIDEDDLEGATIAFQNAMKANPNDPDLASLELILMISRGDGQDLIRERVKFWQRRLTAQGFEPDEPVMQFLDGATQDAQNAFAESIEGSLDESFRILRKWIKEVVCERALPAYRCTELVLEEDEDPTNPRVNFTNGILEGPDYLRVVEAGWKDVFPEDKPFSVELGASSAAWVEEQWLPFLLDTEEAADSLTILDDVLTILDGYARIDWMGVAQDVCEPILEHAYTIVRQTLDENAETILPWTVLDNRPGLRLLYRRAMHYRDTGREQLAKHASEELIRINPNDNHGIRSLVINSYLRDGQNEKAIQLAQDYPSDVLIDVRFGEVLALYRMQRTKDAEYALRKSHYERPLVSKTLWRKRVKQPHLDFLGVTVGGEDEAWLYREEMRDVWASTSGALEWLRKLTG